MSTRGRKLEVEFVGDTSLERAFKKSDDATGWGREAGAAKAAGLGIAGGVGVAGVAIRDSWTPRRAQVSTAKMKAKLKASGIATQAPRHNEYRPPSKLAALDDEDLQDSFTNLVRVTGT